MKIVLLNKYFLPVKIVSVDKTNQWNNYTYGPIELKKHTMLYIQYLEGRVGFYVDAPYFMSKALKVATKLFKLFGVVFVKPSQEFLPIVEEFEKQLNFDNEGYVSYNKKDTSEK